MFSILQQLFSWQVHIRLLNAYLCTLHGLLYITPCGTNCEKQEVTLVSMASCCTTVGLSETSVLHQVSADYQHLMSPCRCIHAQNASAPCNWHTALQHLMRRLWHQWMRCTLSASVCSVLCFACLSLPLVIWIFLAHCIVTPHSISVIP